MQIIDDERSVLSNFAVEHPAGFVVKSIVFGLGTIEQTRPWRLVPYLKAPRILGLLVYGAFGRTVEVHFESRAQPHDPRPRYGRPLIRERIFLPQTLARRERHRPGDLRPKVMPRVDGRRDEGSFTKADPPDTILHAESVQASSIVKSS
jgi:hypothetical protein